MLDVLHTAHYTRVPNKSIEGIFFFLKISKTGGDGGHVGGKNILKTIRFPPLLFGALE